MKVNLAYIRSEVKNSVKKQGLSNTRIDEWANEVCSWIAREMDATFHKEESTKATVDGTRSYFIDSQYRKITDIVDVTSAQPLTLVDENTISRIDPDRADEGQPMVYMLDGYSMTEAQPAAASVITMVSSSALDTTQTVTVTGKLTGILVQETKTLTGIVPVSTTQTFDQVLTVTKSDVTTGYVTVTAGAVSLCIIPGIKLFNHYTKVSLYPVPDGVYSLRITAMRHPREMYNASDVPDLPPEWHDIVLTGAKILGFENNYDWDRANDLKSELYVLIEHLAAREQLPRNPFNSNVINKKPFKDIITTIGRLERYVGP